MADPSKFSIDEWREWTLQRAEGVDTLSDIDTERDPNPHTVIADAYTRLRTDEERATALDGVHVALMDAIDAYSAAEGVGAAGSSLQRVLEVVHAIPILEWKRLQRVALLRPTVIRAKAAIRDDASGKLQRVAFVTAAEVVPLPLNEIVEGLSHPATYVAALRAAMSVGGAAVLPDVLPAFVKMARAESKLQVKLAILRVRDEYISDAASERRLSELLRRAVAVMPIEDQVLVREYASEAGIDIPTGMPVKAKIRQRRVDRAAGNVRGTMVWIQTYYPDRANFRRFMQAIVHRLADRVDAELIEKMPAPWDTQVDLLVKNAIDCTVATIFLTDERAKSASVVPFGAVRTFTCCHARSGELSRLPLFNPDRPFAERLIDTLTSSTSHLELGVHDQTAAYQEVVEALSDYASYGNRLYHGKDPVDLRAWLSRGPSSKVVICDWGVAYQMKDAKSTDVYRLEGEGGRDLVFGGDPFAAKDGKVFAFRRPMQAGFMYPRWDTEWRDEVVAAIRDVVTSFDDVKRDLNWPVASFSQAWQNVQEELRLYGIDPIGLEDIHKLIGVELPEDGEPDTAQKIRRFPNR